MEEQLPVPKSESSAHVLIWPMGGVGHVNSMLKLAELLSSAGIRVTFLNFDHYIARQGSSNAVFSRYKDLPAGFRFKTITDGLPIDHPRTPDDFPEFCSSMASVCPPLLKELLEVESEQPVSCMIADGFMSFAIDVARQSGIPIFYFRTVSACAFWAYHCVPQMIDSAELPIKGDEDMDRLIKNIPGMENFLRCRDLPSVCRAKDPMDNNLQIITRETLSTARVDGLILNTFEDLEGSILSQIRAHCPKTYSIGPLDSHLKTRISENTRSSSGFWEVDRNCMSWLDNQPSQSVIYVSFGSITVMPRDQLMEFWYGLVNSNTRFLWVIRPDLVLGKDGGEQIPEELDKATKERGYIAGWVPQQEVLAHEAVGGFLTHCGWNSTLEGIVAGVPMICWPYFVDQQITSRFVGEIWKLGLDMKDLCDRKIVEKMVIELMVERRDDFVKSAKRMAALAARSVNQGGSSYRNLDLLINDIKTVKSKPKNA